MTHCDTCGKELSGNASGQEKKPGKSKKATVAGAVAAAVAAVVAWQLTSGFMQRDFSGLREFSPPDNSFAVKLPGEVREARQTLNTPLGPLEMFSYCAKAKYQEFVVAYSDYPDSFIAASDPKALLDGSRDGAVRNIGGTLLSETLIDLDGRPGRELNIEGPQKSVLKTRMYLAGNRLYQVMAVTTSDHAFDRKLGDVFESFRIR